MNLLESLAILPLLVPAVAIAGDPPQPKGETPYLTSRWDVEFFPSLRLEGGTAVRIAPDHGEPVALDFGLQARPGWMWFRQVDCDDYGCISPWDHHFLAPTVGYVSTGRTRLFTTGLSFGSQRVLRLGWSGSLAVGARDSAHVLGMRNAVSLGIPFDDIFLTVNHQMLWFPDGPEHQVSLNLGIDLSPIPWAATLSEVVSEFQGGVE